MTGGDLPNDLAAANGTRAARVHIAKLTLSDFRNYASLTLSLESGAVVLTGENGAGKTNLLEAISFLTPGRGLRRAAYTDVARAGAESGFAVHARVEGPLGEVEIGTGTSGGLPGSTEVTRKVRINGATARSADEMLEWLRVLWVTPAMDTLFSGPASDRRRFLDRLVLTLDAAHGRRAAEYERAMRSRNRLLAEDSRDGAWFDAIEMQMAEHGIAIAVARAEMIRLLTTMIERLPGDSPFPRAMIALEGTLDREIGTRPAVETEEVFRDMLRTQRGIDRAAGRTLEGPHRTEIAVHHAAKDMPAASCSTGEQKALLLGIVLSHARLTGEINGQAPILLLDEIAAHLDARRRDALFDILEDLNGQAFMTGTEAALFASLKGKAQFLTVAGGSVSSAQAD